MTVLCVMCMDILCVYAWTFVCMVCLLYVHICSHVHVCVYVHVQYDLIHMDMFLHSCRTIV